MRLVDCSMSDKPMFKDTLFPIGCDSLHDDTIQILLIQYWNLLHYRDINILPFIFMSTGDLLSENLQQKLH